MIVAADYTFAGLSAGFHFVSVTDNLGCDTTFSFNISEPSQVIVNITNIVNVSCFSNNDGQATAAASGGTGVYTYQWDAAAGNQATATASGLFPGIYCVSASDGNGCLAVACATITEPSMMSATIPNQTNVSCFGGADGTATALGIGGTPPYNYIWPTGAVTQTETSLMAGTYCVTVTDINGCFAATCVTISQPPILTINAGQDVTESCGRGM